MEKELISINRDEIRKLTHELKEEVSKLKNRLYLGVFNGKIPVLLSIAQELPPDLPLFFFRNAGKTYRIHFNNPDEEWWISTSENESKIFTFHIPSELQRILAKNDNPDKYAALKKEFMSTLTFTQRIGNEAYTHRLELDSGWIGQVLANVRTLI